MHSSTARQRPEERFPKRGLSPPHAQRSAAFSRTPCISNNGISSSMHGASTAKAWDGLPTCERGRQAPFDPLSRYDQPSRHRAGRHHASAHVADNRDAIGVEVDVGQHDAATAAPARRQLSKISMSVAPCAPSSTATVTFLAGPPSCRRCRSSSCGRESHGAARAGAAQRPRRSQAACQRRRAPIRAPMELPWGETVTAVTGVLFENARGSTLSGYPG